MISLIKTIVALLHRSLVSQDARKRQFLKKLRKNLANNDPRQQDQLVDEFRALILGL